ncbi:hypothetical protein D3C74_322830 [compost metagenome]
MRRGRRIGDGQKVAGYVIRRQGNGLGAALNMAFIIEGNDTAAAAKPVNQGASERRINPPLDRFFSLWPIHGPGVHREQQARSFSLNLHLDPACIMHLYSRHL